ncbi:MAG: hypothetical protein ACXWQQ_17460, partial [Pseudobdellovibrio sp.]
GIDEKTNVPGSEVPIEQFRFGHETPMQKTAGNTALSFNVEIPSLLGVSPEMQSRVIQVYGVYTSLTDKSSCAGKSLSDFLVNEDPYAAVYLIGTNTYPTTNSTIACTGSDLCIEDSIKKNGAGTELMYTYLFLNRDPIDAVYYYSPSLQTALINLFNDSDYADPSALSSAYAGMTANSKPIGTGQVARIDYYFPFSKYLKDRVGSAKFRFSTLQAAEYTNNSGSCSFTPTSSYSTVQLKLWDGLNSTWVNPPIGNSTADFTVAAANEFAYDIFNVQLNDASIQQVTIDGVQYLAMSIRSQNTSCSSLSISLPEIIFY